MHEFSICQNIVRIALGEFEKIEPTPHSISRTRIVVGKLHQIIAENMQFAYEVLTRDTPAENSSLEITFIPIRAVCRKCGWKGDIQEVMYLCGECGSVQLDIETGRELYIENLEVEEDE